MGDNVVYSIFGAGILYGNMSHPSDDYHGICAIPLADDGRCKRIEGWKDSQDDENCSKNTRSAKVDNKTEPVVVKARSA